MQRRINGEDAPERYMIEILSKDGEKFTVEVNITPMTDEKGAIVAVFGVAREILPDEA
jgi:PAS domain S-box-containing protein